jgi:nifR3 family TIM-barrel protein
MKYGNSTLSGRFLLAPMAAYTDKAFRLVCRQRGAAMCFTEFANATALARGIRNSWDLVGTVEGEMPVGIQIFGSEPQIMAKACKLISERTAAGGLFASCIDLNFGCPAGSVIRAGAGSALLRKPERMAEIVEACVKASDLPITCKLRAGWSGDRAKELAILLEKSGAAGITLHWRTATEGRKRSEGWTGLAGVKDALSIPLIANGGATTPERAVRLLRESACDAVMIASGALGNPDIFSQANALLAGKEAKAQIWGERLSDFLKYVSLAQKHELLDAKRLRMQALEFLAGYPGARAWRGKINAAKTVEEITARMESFEPDAYSSSSERKV